MKPDGLLPHAPTALLHRPLIDLGEHGVLAATPWYVRNFVRTGSGTGIARLPSKRSVNERVTKGSRLCLGEFNAPLRLPGTEVEYAALMRRMGTRIGFSPERVDRMAMQAAIERA